MGFSRGWRLVRPLLLGAGLVGAPGCLGFVHPVGPPRAEMAEACRGMPAGARRHVYIFIVNGLDPVNLANLTGLRDYVQALGFPQTYYGQLYHTPWFAAELRRLRTEDPQARFVLVGFSVGSQMVHALAQSARDAGAAIDLMVYLSGNSPFTTPPERPANVERVIILAAGDGAAQGGAATGTEEYHLTDASYFGTPAHPHTLKTLAEELLAVAGHVPLVDRPAPPLPPDPDKPPLPRPVRAETGQGARGEWDFLKPQAQLSPVPRLP